MNLSERSRVDKELFSGERSSYENTQEDMPKYIIYNIQKRI